MNNFRSNSRFIFGKVLIIFGLSVVITLAGCKDKSLQIENESLNQKLRAAKEVEDRLREQLIKREEELKNKDSELKKKEDEFKKFKEDLSVEINKLVAIANSAKELDSLLKSGTEIGAIKEKVALIKAKVESAHQESRLEKIYEKLFGYSADMENAIKIYSDADYKWKYDMRQLKFEEELTVVPKLQIIERKYQIQSAFLESRTSVANIISSSCDKISSITTKILKITKGDQLL
jgi:hypothetical protein